MEPNIHDVEDDEIEDDEPSGPVTVALVESEHYLAHDGQIVRLTPKGLDWVNGSRKIDVAPWRLPVVETMPATEVTELRYRVVFSVAGLFGGALTAVAGLVMIVTMILGRLVSLWMITAAPVLILAGISFVFGVRRRRITAHTPAGELHWTSGPLEFGDSGYAVLHVNEWAEEHGITTIEFPSAMDFLKSRRIWLR